MTDEQAVVWLDGRERLGTGKQAQATQLLAARLGNPQETLRVLDALQTDELCPCNWNKGDDVLQLAA